MMIGYVLKVEKNEAATIIGGQRIQQGQNKQEKNDVFRCNVNVTEG